MGAKIQKTWSDNEIETLRSLVEAGYDYYQIAESLHRNYYSVYNKARRLGLAKYADAQKRRHWRPKEDRYDLVDGHELRLRLEDECETVSEAARKMGVLPGTLNGWIHANYIPRYATLLIEKLFDIPYDTINPSEHEPEPETVEEAQPKDDIRDQELQWDLFFEKLEEAVYRGTKRAFEEI